MKHLKHFKRWGALLLCAAVMSGCQQTNTADAFSSFTRELFVDTITSDGISLHYSLVDPSAYGINAKEHMTHGEYTLENITLSEQEGKETLDRLQKFDRSKLTESQQITYDVLKTSLELDQTADGLGLYANYNGSRQGVLTMLPTLLADFRIESEEDIENYLLLMADLPRCYGQALEFEKQRADAGLFMPEIALDKVVQAGESFLEKPEDSVMITSFEDRLTALDGLDSAKKQDYLDQNHTIWLDQVVPAGRTLLDGLMALRPSCREPVGFAQMGEDGKRYYTYLALATTGWNGTVDEMIKALEEQMAGSLRAMFFAQANSSGFYENVINYFEDPIDLGTEQEQLELLSKNISADFPPLEAVSYEIKEVSPALEKSAAPAYYLSPPVDQPKLNFIYINRSSEQNDLPQNLFSTLSHEGYAGHLYQRNYFRQQNPDPLRSTMSFLGYTEGWAQYVEEWAISWTGVDEKTAQTINHINRLDPMLMARVDLGVNYEGWSKEDTAKFLEGFGISDQEVLDDLYLSVLDDPSNPLPYVFGSMAFRQIRLDAQKQLGDLFDIQALHKAVLDCGPAPFSVVEQQAELFISDTLAAASASSVPSQKTA